MNIRYIARFSPNIFALALTEFFATAGVDLLFDVTCSAPVMEGKHCRGVVIQGKSGREFIRGTPYLSLPIRKISSRETAEPRLRLESQYGFVRIKRRKRN